MRLSGFWISLGFSDSTFARSRKTSAAERGLKDLARDADERRSLQLPRESFKFCRSRPQSFPLRGWCSPDRGTSSRSRKPPRIIPRCWPIQSSILNLTNWRFMPTRHPFPEQPSNGLWLAAGDSSRALRSVRTWLGETAPTDYCVWPLHTMNSSISTISPRYSGMRRVQGSGFQKCEPSETECLTNRSGLPQARAKASQLRG